ncbi:MAG TPA: beta-glucanase [Lentisphaeria bacterium]|nr:beta-glucanase [Lentisphaeria bacterium]
MKRNSFTNHGIWPDHNGVHINAHGGGVLHHDGVYYWYGEHKIEGHAGNRAHVGVHCYSSADLYNWQDEDIALTVSEDPDSEIAKGCVLERPKVIFNRRTGKFVMWFHLELIDQGYNAARSGVAVADSATGPFRYVSSSRPNAGHWPENVLPEQQDPDSIERTRQENEEFTGGPTDKHAQFNILGSHVEGGQMARDMTLFVDDDGKAYHIYSSEHNSTLHISLLTVDYLDHTGTYTRNFPFRWMEAPTIFKRAGKYYLIASGCTSWSPNAARSAVADSILGPWRELDNPCVGTNPENGLGPEKTFGGQSTFVLPVAGQADAYIAMFDLWRPENAIDGRHVWLPIRFTEAGFQMAWTEAWDLTTFGEDR